MEMLKNNYFTIIKYTYLTLCFFCFYNFFASTLPFIDNALIAIREYLPITGILLLVFAKNIHFKNNNIVFILLIITYCFATCIGNNEIKNEYVVLFILGILFSNEKPASLLKFIFVINLIFLSSSLLLSHLNIYSYNIIFRGTEPRYCFNFFHPNVLGLFILSFYCQICYLFKNHKFTIIITGLLFFIFTFSYVDSRTNALLFLPIILMHLFYWICKFISKWIKINSNCLSIITKLLIISIPIICLVVSLYTSIVYSSENELLNKLNDLLTGRIFLQNEAFIKHGIPLFGIQKVFNTGVYDIIDNFFMFTIYKFGIVFEITMLSLFAYLMFKKMNRKNIFNYFLLTVVWCFYGLSEPFLIYFCCNPFLLLLFNNYQKDKELEVAHD